MQFFNRRQRDADGNTIDGTTAHNSLENQHDQVGREEKFAGTVGTPGVYPVLTLRTFFMAILVAMGGFIFGYDTGQISGFLEMPVFLEYFGQRTTNLDEHPTGYYFTDVRSGLIVGMVSSPLVI